MKFIPGASKYLVELLPDQQQKNGFILELESTVEKGRVITDCSYITDETADFEEEIKEGALVVILKDKYHKLSGLNFPATYVVVDVENIIGTIREDEEQNE